MGAAPSTPRPEETAESLIGEFVGGDPHPIASLFWQNLLELPLALHWPSHRVKHACQLLVQNNHHTKHLAKILVHLGWCLEECISGSGVLSSAITKALNALYISTVFLKYLIEYSKSDNFEELHLSLDEEDMPNNLSKDQDIQHFLMYNVLNFVGRVDISPNTYVLHYELLNFMLITMSTQLRCGPSPGPSDFHPFTDAAMAQDSSMVGSVVCKLLLNYITRPRYSVNSNTIFSEDSQPGVLQKVGSVAANFVWLPFNLFTGASDEVSRSPLADISLHILLVLVHYRKCVIADYVKDRSGYSIDSLPKEETCFSENPFCKALENAQDIEFDRADIEGNPHYGPVVKVSFASLFDTLGMYLSQETSVLLLYSLVHGNSNFLEYVLVRTDLDTLLVTLLETLYNASKRSSNHIYMVLIILLILSQDSSFNASIHKLMLPGVTWYRERHLHQTSLGSLMLIVLIRTVKYNLSKLQDVYLHTNCLATLANMAPHVHYLSGYASQRLISLFYMLSRKYNKLAEMKNGKMHEANDDSTEGDGIADDASTELHIYTDFLRIVLEIVNAILTYALPRNPEVVYAIMHRQEVFQPFKNHPRFNELLENIFTVLDFFNVRMDAQKKDGEWSVEKVLQVIITNCRSWRAEGIKMFTPLHFTYEQESHPEEFFIPYVWKLVMSSSGLSFDPGSINLFAVELPVALSTMGSFGEEADKLRNEQNDEFGMEAETPV